MFEEEEAVLDSKRETTWSDGGFIVNSRFCRWGAAGGNVRTEKPHGGSRNQTQHLLVRQEH